MFTRKLTSDHKVIVISALVLFLSFYFTFFAYSTTCNFTIKGDTDKNGEVNASDLFPIAQLYGLTSSSSSGFDCVVDTNEDGKIDASDLFPVAQNYGMKASGTTISGTVTAPSGVSLGRVDDRTANASGLTAAANVQVQAYQVDDAGNKTGNTLATANTDASGNYTLTLPSSITIASNLIVSVGSGDNQMRAIVTGTTETININPITELVTKKIVESTASLTEFTTEEVKSIKTQVETAAASINFSTTNTVSAAVTTLYTGSIATTLDTGITQAEGANHSPTIESVPITTAIVGETYFYLVFAMDQDVNDTLTYSLTTAPKEMTINSTTGIIAWKPLTAGTYNVTVSVSDDKGNTASQAFEILANVVPLAVTLNTPANITTSSLTLSWSQSLDSNFALYKIYRSTSSGSSQSLTLIDRITARTTTTKTVVGLSPGITYYFKVYICTDTSCRASNKVAATTTTISSGQMKILEGVGNIKFIQQTHDGGYIMIVADYYSNWVEKFDVLGNRKWSYYGIHANDLLQNSNDEYVVVGDTGSNAAIVKLDAEGKVNSSYTSYVVCDSKYISCSKYATSITRTSDDGYIVIGGVYNRFSGYSFIETPHNRYPWIIKFDNTMNVEWEQIYESYEYDDMKLYSIIQTENGDYIAGGEGYFFYGNGNAETSAMVAWFDKNSGNSMKKVFFKDATAQALDVIKSDDGGYIVFGIEVLSIFVRKIDVSGNMVWHKKYGKSEDLCIDFSEFFCSHTTGSLNAVDRTADGGYIIVGMIGPYIWILKLDAFGNKLWQRLYGYETGCLRPISIQTLSNGNYILEGNSCPKEKTGSSDKSDVFISNVDSNGNCDGCF